MKYIDAEKLTDMIDNSIAYCQINYSDDYALGFEQSLREVKNFITSLQQEQSEFDLDDDFVFDEIMSVYDSNGCLPPRDGESLEMLEKVFHHAFSIGRNANKMESDLVKETGRWMDRLDDKYCTLVENYSIQDIKDTARHFYELGLNTRKDD